MKNANTFAFRFFRFLAGTAVWVVAAGAGLGCDAPMSAQQSPADVGSSESGGTRPAHVAPVPDGAGKRAHAAPVGGQTPSESDPYECRAAILIYHHISPHTPGESADTRGMTVSPAALDKQLRYLREHGYNVVPYGNVVDCVVKRVPLPEKAVVITFDDGWSSQYVNALPILEKYGMTATFFVVTDYVDRGSAILTWKQIKTLDAKGMTIAAHSRSHPFLTRIWDAGRLRNEIAGSKKVIEDHLGKPVLFFAYPYGGYDQRVVNATRAAGYAAARGTYDGTHHVPSDLFFMKGIYVTDSLDRLVRDMAQ